MKKAAREKRKSTPGKDSSKKKPAKSTKSISSDELKALDFKWLEKFSKLEAILLVKVTKPSQ